MCNSNCYRYNVNKHTLKEQISKSKVILYDERNVNVKDINDFRNTVAFKLVSCESEYLYYLLLIITLRF